MHSPVTDRPFGQLAPLGLTELLALGADAVWTPEPSDTVSCRPTDWQGFLNTLASTEVPADFLDAAERPQIEQDRDHLADIDP